MIETMRFSIYNTSEKMNFINLLNKNQCKDIFSLTKKNKHLFFNFSLSYKIYHYLKNKFNFPQQFFNITFNKLQQNLLSNSKKKYVRKKVSIY